MSQLNPARVLKDRRTKNLTKRLRPGDIALIHHADLDTTAARALVDCGVAAVVNAAQSITGRYPNRGPSVLLEAGIPLLDHVGEAGFVAAPEGRRAVLEGDVLRFAEGVCLQGTLLDAAQVTEQMEAARANLSAELDQFARNTLEYLNREKSLLFDPIEVPPLRTRFTDKHVLIVVRGEGYKQDLAQLNEYLRDVRPVLLAVDGGADALLESRLRPDVIVGDMDSVSDEALRCGAELVVHGYARGDERGAPGLERICALGLEAKVFHSTGTSEDVAMLLADELGARLIVAVGTHFSLEDFLDKGRHGMASTFLTRLRIGSKLVDAKGIARLWSGQRLRLQEIGLIVAAAATPVAAVLLLSDMGKGWLKFFGLAFRFNLFRYHFQSGLGGHSMVIGLLLVSLGVMVGMIGLLAHGLRRSVEVFVNTLPRELQDLVIASDPKARRAFRLLRRLPRISWACGGVGFVLFLLGLTALPLWSKLLVVGAAAAAAIGMVKLGRQIAPRIQQQVLRTLKSQI